MKKIYILSLPLIILASCGSSGNGKTDASNSKEATAAATDSTTAISSKTDTSTTDAAEIDAVTSATSKPNEVLFNGTIAESPQHHATVAVTMGGTVSSTTLLPGRYIGKGAVVASLKNPEFIELQQTYLDCHAQSEYLKNEYDRKKALIEGGATSEKSFQASKAEYLSNESKLQSAAAQLKLLGVSPALISRAGIQQLLQVRAPISGYISTVSVNVGKYVQAGESICEIVDKGQMLLCLTAYEKDISKMRVGKKIEFRVNGIPDRTFKAVIISVGQNIDGQKRATEVYARIIDKDARFLPGMYVNARLT